MPPARLLCAGGGAEAMLSPSAGAPRDPPGESKWSGGDSGQDPGSAKFLAEAVAGMDPSRQPLELQPADARAGCGALETQEGAGVCPCDRGGLEQLLEGRLHAIEAKLEVIHQSIRDDASVWSRKVSKHRPAVRYSEWPSMRSSGSTNSSPGSLSKLSRPLMKSSGSTNSSPGSLSKPSKRERRERQEAQERRDRDDRPSRKSPAPRDEGDFATPGALLEAAGHGSPVAQTMSSGRWSIGFKQVEDVMPEGEEDCDSDSSREEEGRRDGSDTLLYSGRRGSNESGNDGPSRLRSPRQISRGVAKRLTGTMPSVWDKVLTRDPRKEKLWHFFEEPESSVAASIYHKFMSYLVLGTALMPVVHTLPEKVLSVQTFFAVSTATDAIFLAELMLRWFVSPSTENFMHGFYNILDLAILGPFIVRVAFYDSLDKEDWASQFASAMLLCVVPVMRLVKALRTVPNFNLLLHTLRGVMEPLSVPGFMLAVTCLTFSSALYVVEKDQLVSMPHAMYLVVVTISTVGYGDIYPKTDLGRAVVALLILFGVLCMAMPITIVGTAFTDVWKNRFRIQAVGRMHSRLRQWGYTEEDLRLMFKTADVDNSGELDQEEFQKMVSTMRLGLNEKSINALFKVFDDDNSGAVDIEEFVEGIGLNRQGQMAAIF